MRRNGGGYGGGYGGGNGTTRVANVFAIVGVICYSCGRMLEAAIGCTGYAMDRALTLAGINAALIAVLMLAMRLIKTNRENVLAIFVPVAIYSFILAGAIATRDFQYYFLVLLATFGIACMYQNFARSLAYFGLTNVVNSILFIFYFPRMDRQAAQVIYWAIPGGTDGVLLVSWFVSFVASASLLVLTYVATRKSGEANQGLMAFDTLLQATPNYTILVDQMNKVRYISEPLAEFARIADRRIVEGRPLLDLFGDKSLKLMFADILDSKEFYEGTREIVIDGAARHYKIIAAKLSGEVNGMFIDITDITHVIEAQLAAEEAKLAADKASRAKSDFLASMSHEIRTPMNTIIGMSDLMRMDNLDKTQAGYFNDIKRTSKALLQIVNDILDFSKIEAGKMDLIEVDFNLRSIFEMLCSLNQFTAAAKDIAFLSSYADDVPDIVRGDELRVRQVIANVLSNAVKYTREGHVRFKVERAEARGADYVAFAVEDTGIGIREENMAQLFASFQQLDAEANKGIVGTGLGLSIVKRLTDIMGGAVEVSSVHGMGSTFTVFLPLPAGDPERVAEAVSEPRVVACGDTAVLVVDDNPMNVTVALGFLATHNIGADTAPSGPAALDMIRRKRYDIVFMDQMMPDMDGIEATRRIREWEATRARVAGAKAGVPIIALTANAVTGMRETYIAAGMDDYIAKPIVADELNRALLRWLPDEKVLRKEPRAWSEAQDVAKAEERSAEAKKRIVGRASSSSSSSGGPVIDTAVGLGRSANSEPLYRQLLKDFTKKHGDSYARIVDALASGDNGLAYRLAHTLKSSARLIGADVLGDAAHAVEMSLFSSDGLCPAEQPIELRRELGQVLSELAAMGIQEEREPPKSREFDSTRAGMLAEKLEPMLKAQKPAVCRYAYEILDVFASFGGAGEVLVRQIEGYDFRAAMQTLQSIKERLDGQSMVGWQMRFDSAAKMDEDEAPEHMAAAGEM